MPQQPRPRLATLAADICVRLLEKLSEERQLHRVWRGILLRWYVRPRRCHDLLAQCTVRRQYPVKPQPEHDKWTLEVTAAHSALAQLNGHVRRAHGVTDDAPEQAPQN